MKASDVSRNLKAKKHEALPPGCVRVLMAIIHWQQRNGSCPGIKEIGLLCRFGKNYRFLVRKNLQKLKAAGLVDWERYGHQTIHATCTFIPENRLDDS